MERKIPFLDTDLQAVPCLTDRSPKQTLGSVVMK